MKLVLLCKEQDFKHFGQDLVMGPHVKDLKNLGVSGFDLPDRTVCKVTLCAIAGDNLRSPAADMRQT